MTWSRILLTVLAFVLSFSGLGVLGVSRFSRGASLLPRLLGLGILMAAIAVLVRGFRSVRRLVRQKRIRDADLKAGCLCAWASTGKGYAYTFHPECPLHRSSLGGARDHDLP